MVLRNLFVFICFWLFSVTGFAQAVPATEVPYNVRETFYAKFQRVTEAKWEKRKPNIYFVSFRKGDRNIMAEFSEDGRWQSTGEIVSVGQLPRDVIASVAKNLKGHKMKSGIKKDTYTRGLIYTVSTEEGGKTFEFTFNPAGKILYYKETTAVKP